MKSPAAVVRSPIDKSCHFLFFVKPEAKKLAFEKRPIHISKCYSPYVNNRIIKGIIDPCAPIAAALQGDTVSVYGLTVPDEKDHKRYLSKLSPTHNILVDATGKPIILTEDFVASCSDGRALTFVYYISPAENQGEYQFNELELWGESDKGLSMPMDIGVFREINSLCAVINRETLVRFVFFVGWTELDQDYRLRWACSEGQEGDCVIHGDDFDYTYTLAVATREGYDPLGPYLDIFLYCSDYVGSQIFRIVGRARGRNIEWFTTLEVTMPTLMTSSLTVINEDRRNYVYYMPSKSDKYEAYVDVIQDDWFKPQVN